MRGVHIMASIRSISIQGSSPHARGPLVYLPIVGGDLGIIPACAGSTRLGSGCPGRHRDHPRMRGVHFFVPSPLFLVIGSSPHARGPPVDGGGYEGRIGIIPACAGSTSDSAARVPHDQDHPRMRGVHIKPRPPAIRLRGSSPHARGPHRGGKDRSLCQGIIPACAGSTLGCHYDFCPQKDHPRMRGVHLR